MDEPIAVERARKGDHEAFGALVEHHGAAIANYLYRFMPDKDDIDDRLQEVFLKAYLSMTRFDPTRGAFRTWLFRIAANTSLDEVKRRRREEFRRETASTTWRDDTSTAWLPGEEAHSVEHLRTALQSLPALERQVVLLSFYHDLTYREIAQILDIPLGTVKSRMRSAMTRLRREVSLHEAGDIR